MEITNHAKRRLSQRGIRFSDIDTVVKLGCKIHRTGMIFYTFRKKDISKASGVDKHLEKLEGVTFLVSPKDGAMITAYKNRRSFNKIKKKSKWAGIGSPLREIRSPRIPILPDTYPAINGNPVGIS